MSRNPNSVAGDTVGSPNSDRFIDELPVLIGGRLRVRPGRFRARFYRGCVAQDLDAKTSNHLLLWDFFRTPQSKRNSETIIGVRAMNPEIGEGVRDRTGLTARMTGGGGKLSRRFGIRRGRTGPVSCHVLSGSRRSGKTLVPCFIYRFRTWKEKCELGSGFPSSGLEHETDCSTVPGFARGFRPGFPPLRAS